MFLSCPWYFSDLSVATLNVPWNGNMSSLACLTNASVTNVCVDPLSYIAGTSCGYDVGVLTCTSTKKWLEAVLILS